MSLISMTGFGSGSAAVNGNQVYAEISTINRKQLEIRFSLPREFAPFEHELRKLLQSKLSRGMVSVRMSKNVSGSAAAGINRERVKALIRIKIAKSEYLYPCRKSPAIDCATYRASPLSSSDSYTFAGSPSSFSVQSVLSLR